MSTIYTLLQFGDDPFRHRYVDPDGRSAFSIQKVLQDPNLVIRLSREAEWTQQHPSILGPENSYFYMGPGNSAGYIVYGSSQIHIPMPYFLRVGKKEFSVCVCHSFLGPSVFPSGDSNIGSIGGKPTDSLHRVALVLNTYFSSRYWRTQGGKEYKWKRISQYRMECHDNRGSIIAWWEVSEPKEEYYAKISLKPDALTLITEVMSTLILNQMDVALSWQ